MARDTLDDALDRAIDALRAGRPFDAVLAAEPAHARELRPLLEAVRAAAAIRPAMAPAPARLNENYATVRAALEHAQAAQRAALAPSWWRRKVAFASLSLPAGAVVALALGAGGAAAATVVVARSDVPALASAVTPDWAAEIITGGHGDGSSGLASGPDAAHTVPAPASTAGSENQPTAIDVSGVISEVNGNTFTLNVGDDAYSVNFADDALVTGAIEDGATATVRGDVTAQKNLHAREIIVTAAPVAAATEDPAAPDRTPKPTRTPRPGTTPPGQADENGDGPPAEPPGIDASPTKKP